jgi:hypothetical protein
VVAEGVEAEEGAGASERVSVLVEEAAEVGPGLAQESGPVSAREGAVLSL